MDARKVAENEIREFYGDSVSEETITKIMNEWNTDNIYDLIEIIPRIDSNIDFYQECVFDISTTLFKQVSIPKWIAYNNMPCINDCEKIGDEYKANEFYKPLRDEISKLDENNIQIGDLLNSVFNFFITKYNDLLTNSNECLSVARKTIDQFDIIAKEYDEAVKYRHSNDWFFNMLNNMPRNQKKTDGFVYIAKQTNENNIYKIGKTTNISGREKTFKTGNLYIKMIAYKMSNNAQMLESILHKRCLDKNISGEWFLLSDSEITTIINEYGFNLVLEPPSE